MSRPDGRGPCQEGLLDDADGRPVDGPPPTTAATLATSAPNRARLLRREETGRLLRDGTPLVDEAAGRAALRARLDAERAALPRPAPPRRLAMSWRHPGLAVALTTAALPLVLLLTSVAMRPFGDAGDDRDVVRATSVPRDVANPTPPPSSGRMARATARSGPEAARRRYAAWPRLDVACETPRRVSAARSTGWPDGEGRRLRALPVCVPRAAAALPPPWSRASAPPRPAVAPLPLRPPVVQTRRDVPYRR